jgi:hypothetical protein
MIRKLLTKWFPPLTDNQPEDYRKTLHYIEHLVDNKLAKRNHLCFVTTCDFCKNTNKKEWPLKERMVLEIAAKTFSGLSNFDTELNFNSDEPNEITTKRLVAFANLLALELHDLLPTKEEVIEKVIIQIEEKAIHDFPEYHELHKQLKDLEEEISLLKTTMATKETNTSVQEDAIVDLVTSMPITSTTTQPIPHEESNQEFTEVNTQNDSSWTLAESTETQVELSKLDRPNPLTGWLT